MLISELKKDIREILKEIFSEDFRYQYDATSFVPTLEMANVAKNALSVINRNKQTAQGANEGSGSNKAKDLANRNPINHSQLKRMKAFFDNNEENFKSELNKGKTIENSGIIQTWNLWGGDIGRNWVENQIKSTKSQNKTSKKVRNPEDGIRTKNLMNPHNTRIHR